MHMMVIKLSTIRTWYYVKYILYIIIVMTGKLWKKKCNLIDNNKKCEKIINKKQKLKNKDKKNWNATHDNKKHQTTNVNKVCNK